MISQIGTDTKNVIIDEGKLFNHDANRGGVGVNRLYRYRARAARTNNRQYDGDGGA